MEKQNFLKRIKTDAVFRNRFTLTFTFIWGFLLTAYYFIIGIYSSCESQKWSWFVSLGIWYFVIIIFKMLLMINAFKIKQEKWIDFKLMTIVYLFINLFEVLFITISPNLFVQTFGSKIHKSISISSLVVSGVNIVLFILNWVSIKREKFTKNEADFLLSKQYIGRTEGLFNIMLIVINTLIICSVSEKIIGYVYVGIGSAFALLSLILAIKLIKKRKWDLSHKK